MAFDLRLVLLVDYQTSGSRALSFRGLGDNVGGFGDLFLESEILYSFAVNIFVKTR